MKRFLPLIIVVMAAASGCTTPLGSVARISTTAAMSGNTQQTTSSGTVKPATSDDVATTQASVESEVRGMLTDSQISTVQSTLATVGSLDTLDNHNATGAGLSADSHVWKVTVTGNLKQSEALHLLPFCPNGTATCKQINLLLSAKDGHVLSAALVEPSCNSSPAAK